MIELQQCSFFFVCYGKNLSSRHLGCRCCIEFRQLITRRVVINASRLNSVYASGNFSSDPDYEYLDRLFLGLGRKMMRGKATISTKLEDDTKKRTHSRQKECVGFFFWPCTICYGTSRSSPSMVPEPYQGDYGPRTSCFPSLVKLLSSRIPFLMRTAGYANQHVVLGARQWQEDVDGLGVFDDGAFFLGRGGETVVQLFLDNGLMQDFGILDMNGIRAAHRAVRTPPLFCLGSPPILIPPATDECDVASERPYVCPECNDAFETLRQLVAQQIQTPTWHRHSDQHVCMCRNIVQGSTSDRSSSSTIMETEILHGKGWSSAHRGLTRPYYTLTVTNISNQSPRCLNT